MGAGAPLTHIIIYYSLLPVFGWMYTYKGIIVFFRQYQHQQLLTTCCHPIF